MDSRELAMRLDRLQIAVDELLKLDGIFWDETTKSYFQEESDDEDHNDLEESNRITPKEQEE